MAWLVDTDIMIEYLQGIREAANVVDRRPAESFLSAVSVAELHHGLRSDMERLLLGETLAGFTILPVTQEIAEEAGQFSRDFGEGHDCGLADCLVAATAVQYNLRLVTLEAKYYPMLAEVHVPYLRRK